MVILLLLYEVDMLLRLANVVYYLCVIIGMLTFIYWFFLGFSEYLNQSRYDSLFGGSLIGFIFLSISSLIGWAIRYVITGNKSLL